MKKVDIIVCFALAILSAILAVVISRAAFGDPEDAVAFVEVIDEISAQVHPPDPLVFNRFAIDPTIEICIGDLNVGSDISADECFSWGEIINPGCNPDIDPDCVPDSDYDEGN
ncbi:hypothetical protein FWC63_02155 [Candidatus Saccharibacteria bacterium]|nr:hypothetical protein [Candidatus Saccharibacteria bacterium]